MRLTPTPRPPSSSNKVSCALKSRSLFVIGQWLFKRQDALRYFHSVCPSIYLCLNPSKWSVNCEPELFWHPSISFSGGKKHLWNRQHWLQNQARIRIVQNVLNSLLPSENNIDWLISQSYELMNSWSGNHYRLHWSTTHQEIEVHVHIGLRAQSTTRFKTTFIIIFLQNLDGYALL